MLGHHNPVIVVPTLSGFGGGGMEHKNISKCKCNPVSYPWHNLIISTYERASVRPVRRHDGRGGILFYRLEEIQHKNLKIKVYIMLSKNTL